jgi:hypothetical protein
MKFYKGTVVSLVPQPTSCKFNVIDQCFAAERAAAYVLDSVPRRLQICDAIVDRDCISAEQVGFHVTHGEIFDVTFYAHQHFALGTYPTKRFR